MAAYPSDESIPPASWHSRSWDVIATLTDDGRRALYEHVRTAGHPVTREEAADALGIGRPLAAFHLDKLTETGLLRARYEAPAGQSRGRGRAPKVYEAADAEVTVSLPERAYAVAARILADAVAEHPTDAAAAVAHHARLFGRELATESAPDPASDGTVTALERLVGTLSRIGYRPHVDDDRIQLVNCPFHALAARRTELICGLNLALVKGAIDGCAAVGCRARLAPAPGMCCVEVDLPGSSGA
jgi:predicted ArsR family transcriptional regulator